MVQYKIEKKLYEVVENFSGTPEVEIIRFKPVDGKPMNFDAGMFVMTYGIDENNKQYIGRAFSIASEPNADILELFIVKEHNNYRSHFMDAKIGDKFYIAGPYGQFKFVPEENKKSLFIAGGTGVAPFISTLRHIRNNKYDVDSVLLYSIKYPTEIIMKDELEEIEKEIKLKKVITVTRPSETDSWNGEKGHIDANMIKKYAPDIDERTVYICGPLNFVKAMKDSLKELNVDPKKISADVWG